MENAVDHVYTLSQEFDITLREAAYMLALQRLEDTWKKDR
jgi:glutamate dehydrogenase/leucine dehydrogenase